MANIITAQYDSKTKDKFFWGSRKLRSHLRFIT